MSFRILHSRHLFLSPMILSRRFDLPYCTTVTTAMLSATPSLLLHHPYFAFLIHTGIYECH